MVQVIKSQCWECSTFCGTLVHKEGDQVLKITGNPDHPGSKGAFCVKGAHGALALRNHPNRLLHPLVREGKRGEGRWRQASWDEALARAAEGLGEVKRKYGPLAIAGAVSGPSYSRGAMMALLLRSLGSPNYMINQDLCHGCRAVSDLVTGIGLGGGGEEFEQAKLALLVGRSPSDSSPVLWKSLREARRRGLQVVVVDPRRTKAADEADLHLAIRPGTDRALALGMLHVIIREGLYDREFVGRWCVGFDELARHVEPFTPERMADATGLTPEQIVEVARRYATEKPATLSLGHGVDAQAGGVQTARAFHILVAITGNLDVPGGSRRVQGLPGFKTYEWFIRSPEHRLDRSVEEQIIGGQRFPLYSGPEGWAQACHNPSVVEAILTGDPYPIRAMYVSGVNIAVTYPNSARTLEALESLDFFVAAFDQLTPTANLADVVLPKTVALEEEEVQWQVKGACLSYTAPVLPPAGEARTDTQIAIELLDELRKRGLVERDLIPWRSHEEFLREQLAGTGLTLEEVRERGYATIPTVYRGYEQKGFPTPSGKLELYASRLAEHGLAPLPGWDDAEAPAASPDYPLLLLTGVRTITYHHSRFRDHAWAQRQEPDPTVQLHPETAHKLGLEDGVWANCELKGGSGGVRLRIKHNDRVAPGVASTGMGWWRHGPDGAPDLSVNLNGATSYGPPWDDVMGAPNTHGIPCRLIPTPS